MVEEPSQDPGDPSEPEKETLDKIAAAQAQNSDVVGWLTIPNTTIDAEVLQKVGDNVYYERRDITQKYNWYGCYYADGGNTFGTRNDLTKNTIIYGHNMEDKANGLKFAQLMHYLDVDWASKNPYIYFSTPEDDMVFQVYAVFYTDTGFQYHLENPDTATFDNIIKEARLRSELNLQIRWPQQHQSALCGAGPSVESWRRDQGHRQRDQEPQPQGSQLQLNSIKRGPPPVGGGPLFMLRLFICISRGR